MKLVAVVLLATTTFACAAPRVAADPTVIATATPKPPGASARAKFDAALAVFVQHDEANDWTAASCASVAAMFDEATAAQRGPFAQATFDAGLAFQRCNDDERARARFERASKEDPSFHAAQAKLALYRFKKDANADAAIGLVQRAVIEGQFKNIGALVDLATMQLARDGSEKSPGCSGDLECAKLNLQRALAIDETYMPALNQLGLYYLQLARKRAGGRGKHANVQQLELAALVCSQAIRKNPHYAPIHNTAGLIMHELGQVNAAVDEFAQAAKLDPRFFEAQMNFAAVNLSFRGFEVAQQAYRKALEMRPNDYDAHLGLALALRGPITGAEADYDQRVASVQSELDVAKKVDPQRPDAWFNEGILSQEFKAKPGSTDAQALAALDRAQSSFNSFLDKARGKAAYDSYVEHAKERLQDIDTAKSFLGKTGNPPPKTP